MNAATQSGLKLVSQEEKDLAAGLSAVIDRFSGAGAKLVALDRLSGGANQELWSLDVEDAGGRRHGYVLRRNWIHLEKPETGAGMEVEARLIRLADEVGAPVPHVVYVFEESDNLGSGYIMQRVAGETLARKLLRDEEYAEARKKMAFQLGEAAAKIHKIDLAKAGDLRRTTVDASIAAAEELYKGNGMRRPVVEWGLRWLKANKPTTETAPKLVHGDLRNGNVMVGPEGLRAVLDWEVAHIGDPMEDLAWVCVTSWRFGEIDKPAGGFGSREELFAGYESVSGEKVDAARVKFFEVLGTLRWGLSCALMGQNFLRGDRSVERAAIGRRSSETEIDLLAILAPRGIPHA